MESEEFKSRRIVDLNSADVTPPFSEDLVWTPHGTCRFTPHPVSGTDHTCDEDHSLLTPE